MPHFNVKFEGGFEFISKLPGFCFYEIVTVVAMLMYRKGD